MSDRFSSNAGVLCKVCGDRASGKHYGVPSCDGCRGFFKRSIRRNLEYVCKEGGKCIIDVSRRNQCQSCRFSKCIEANMRREAVQHERAPKIPTANSITTQNSLNYAAAASLYVSRNPEGIFPFHMPFPSPMTFNFDNYYIPTPYYPHLTESLNLKINQNIYKPSNPFTPSSSYDYGIGKLSAETSQLQKADTLKVDKENEVSSSEEIPSTIIKSAQSLSDSATKLLFLTIRWIKSISSFNQFSAIEQKKLVMSSWPELFVLSAAQWGFTIDNEQTGFLKSFQNLIKHYNNIKIDHFESACLKALILFRGECFSDGISQQKLQGLQNQSLCLLIEKCGSLRFGHLMLFLTQIRIVGNAQDLQENLLKTTSSESFIAKILDDF